MSIGTWPTFLDQRGAENRACLGEDTDLFFPERGDHGDEAKAICDRCPLKQTCRDWALTQPDLYGVWGGLTDIDRRRIRRRERAANPTNLRGFCKPCGTHYGNWLRVHTAKHHAPQEVAA